MLAHYLPLPSSGSNARLSTVQSLRSFAHRPHLACSATHGATHVLALPPSCCPRVFCTEPFLDVAPTRPKHPSPTPRSFYILLVSYFHSAVPSYYHLLVSYLHPTCIPYPTCTPPRGWRRAIPTARLAVRKNAAIRAASRRAAKTLSLSHPQVIVANRTRAARTSRRPPSAL